MWRRAALLALLGGAAAGCRGCGPSQPPDAGVFTRSTDLRTAVFTLMPELRGLQLRSGEARVVRTVRWSRKASLEDAVLALAAKNGFLPPDGGGALAARPPFQLRLAGEGEERELSVVLPIGESELNRLLTAPASMSSEQLALYLPWPEGAQVVSERFVLELAYESRPARAAFLTWQMVSMLTGAGWKVDRYPEGFQADRLPDGGAGEVPQAFELEARNAGSGAMARVRRDGGLVHLTYTLAVKG